MKESPKFNGFSVDLGGTKTAAARIVNGTIVDRNQAPTDGNACQKQQVMAMGELLRRLGYHGGDTLGVAVSGRVDSFGVWHAVNLHTLAKIGSVSIVEDIRSAIGPASVINDAAAATLAEATLGRAVGFKNFGYITISTGVGGGIVLDGRLHETTNGLAGHIGFSSSAQAQELCGSGRFGTVESIASGNSIARSAARFGYNGLQGKDVFEHADRGEEWAETIIDRSAKAIANLCADLTTILGLHAVILGGSVGMANGYIKRVRVHLEQLPEIFRPELFCSTLGSEGPLLGALLHRTAIESDKAKMFTEFEHYKPSC